MDTTIAYLRAVSLFAKLGPDRMQRLADGAVRRDFEQGDTIVTEGDRDSRLFVILSGSVNVVKSRGERSERLLGSLGPGDYFGEMALIDELERSATVIANEPTTVLSLDRLDLRKEIELAPDLAIDLLTLLSRRVRLMQTSLLQNLGGLLPICLNCKNIRTEDGSWERVEDYVARHCNADFTHGMCPDCLRKLYPKHFGDDKHLPSQKEKQP